MPKMVFGGSYSKELAKKIAKKLRCPYGEVIKDYFPDGETRLKLNKSPKGKQIIYVNSGNPNPNDSLIESIFSIKTLKEHGAKKVIFVVPYMYYLRQDKHFEKLDCQSNKIMAELLKVADKVITIDGHIHRIKSLKDIFKIPAKNLTSNPVLTEYIKKHYKNEVIIGPDWESYQWAEDIAKHLGVKVNVLKKTRYSSHKVKVEMRTKMDLKGKNVVIVDDVISTGRTIVGAARIMKRMGAKKIYAVCVHGLFAEDSLKHLSKYVDKVVCTNTIISKVNKKNRKIDVSGLIAENV